MSTFTIFLILILIVSFLLIVTIMVQNPKGGGLSSSFGGGGNQQIGGVKQTSDFLDKSTWVLATLLLVLILLSNVTIMQPSQNKILDGFEGSTEIPEAQSIPPMQEEATPVEQSSEE